MPGQESFVPPDPAGVVDLSVTQGLFTYSDMADDVVALLDAVLMPRFGALD